MKDSNNVLSTAGIILMVLSSLFIAYFWVGFVMANVGSIFPSKTLDLIAGFSLGVVLMSVAVWFGPIIMTLFTTVSVWMWAAWISFLFGFLLFKLSGSN